MHTLYPGVKNTGLFSLELKEWRKKAETDKTWEIFKKALAEEYHDLMEEMKFTSGDAVFHLDNAMKETGEALEHLDMEVTADNDIVSRLTESVKELT